MSLMSIEEPRAAIPDRFAGMPLWALGFRPFYLLAAAFAFVSVPLWSARYLGWMEVPAHVNINWHMHEMLFGFAVAVIIGFLYTAARNWTGLWTPRHGHLAALAGLWVAGRVAMIAAPPAVAMIVDLAFLPAAGWPLYQVLKRSGNRRNMFLVGLLALLTFINFLFHASVLGWMDISSMRIMEAAIFVVVFMESAIGARVIPMFTANAVPGIRPVTHARRDVICMALTVLASLAWIFLSPSPLAAGLALAAACAQVVRLAGWKPHGTLKLPLLWILHLSYAWIPLGFFLLALASMNVIGSSAAFHVLAVGSMGGLIIGMITRTALGHTGRMLKAGHGETVMYVLLQLGVIARFCAALNVMDYAREALAIAAFCWSAAFLLYIYVYGPYLLAPRVDGKEG